VVSYTWNHNSPVEWAEEGLPRGLQSSKEKAKVQAMVQNEEKVEVQIEVQNED
jgi:hypothetical protein